MRAAVYTETGDVDVLEVVEREVPELGEGDVLVRLHVAAVNPTDVKVRTGAAPGEPVGEQVPGQDGAGVVERVGAACTVVEPGQRVWVWDAAWNRSEGTAQERIVLPGRHVVPVPAGASFDEAACLGIPALTAHRCLTIGDEAARGVRPGSLAGRTVLVAGGAGAVGHAAIQLARWAGAVVITTVSSDEKADLARRAGAQYVVNYRSADAIDQIRLLAPEGVHRIVEVSPAANVELNSGVVARNAVIASYADDRAPTLVLPVRPQMVMNTTYAFVHTYTVPEDAKLRAVADVSAALADGAMPVGVDAGLPLHRFTLDTVRAAHAAVADGAVGQVLIDLT
jgi:NADPH2:quinone reductase